MAAWRRNFRVVWIANFITAIGMLAFLPLFPFHLREMGLTDERSLKLWSGALVAAAPLTAAFMGPLWGAVGDRIGRKPMMLRANGAIALFVGLMWLAQSPWQLLVLRLLQGVFSGFIAPAMTLVSVTTPPERQGRVAALLHTSVLAGNLCGPLVGGWVGDQFAYRHAFLLCSAASLFALLLVKALVVEAPDTRAVRAEPGAHTLRELLRHAFAEARGFLTPGPLRSMVASVFTVRVAAVLMDPLLALFVATLAGASAGQLGTVTGAVFGATAAATLLVTPIWGRLADEHGPGRLLALCAMGAGACLIPQAFVTHVAQLWVLRFGSGVFLAGMLPAACGLAAKLSPVEQRGAANGFLFSAIGLANAVGPLCGGIVAAVLDLRVLFGIAGGAMVAVGLFLRARQRRIVEVAGGLVVVASCSLLVGPGCASPDAEPASATARTTDAAWRPLFDGGAAGSLDGSLDGWQPVAFGGGGTIEVRDGVLVLGMGSPLTGIRWPGDFPTDDYELEVIAARRLGNDFFCGLTFPVADAHLSLVLGGWGGALCGLSSLDGHDAASNETKSFHRFERGRDYRILVRVADGRVAAWLDEELLCDISLAGRKLSLRPEVEPCRPLGMASYTTETAVRSVRWRPVVSR